MNSIEYIEEDVKEEIGVIYLDPSRDESYTDQDIMKLIERAGIPYQEGNEYELIPGDEKEKAKVVVYQHVKKSVPYKVERTLIGNFSLTSNFQTDESQRDRAYALMHIAGLDVEDETKFEVEAQKDEMGRITSYVVYQITKTPLQEDKSIVLASSSQKMDTIEDLQRFLEELKNLRASIDNMSDEDEKKKGILTLVDGVQSLEGALERVNHKASILKGSGKVENIKFGLDSFTNELKSMFDSISKQNKDYKEEVSSPVPTKMADVLEKDVQHNVQQSNQLAEKIALLSEEYQRSQDRFENIKNESETSDLSSEEDEYKKQTEKMEKLVDENNSSSFILKMVDAEEKRRNNYEREAKKKQADKKIAEALDLTVEEYMEIKDALGRRGIVEAIMERKGLLDIFHKSAKERTAEEKELLRKTKDDVIREIHEKRKEESLSVFDTIQVLYHLDLTLSRGEHPKVLKVSKKEINKIENSISHSPIKIANNNSKKDVDYVPDSIPEDLKDTIDHHGHIGFQETIALFHNVHSGETYIREYGLERFNLIPIGPSVMIEGAICYPISKEDSQRIVEHQNNDYSPYRVVSREIDSRKIDSMSQKESLESFVYIKKLLQYVQEHDISIYRYYLDLAKQYHDNKDNLDFKPEEFEQHNPFLKEEDYQVLRNSEDERMGQYFASAMRKVIDYHLAEYQEEKKEEKKEEKDDSLEVEFYHDEYFKHGKLYYVEFHYTNDAQKQKIFELFENKLIPLYGSHSERADQQLGYIMPYLVDNQGEFTVEDSGIVGGTSIPEDLLDDFMKIFIEDVDATLIVGDEQMSGSFDEDRFHIMLSKLIDEDHFSQEEVSQYMKELSNYTLRNNINIHDYYKNLAKSYREEENFKPEGFERNNPFMNPEEVEKLVSSEDDSITEDFANRMSQLIQKQRQMKEDKKDLEEDIPVFVDLDNEKEKYLQDKIFNNYHIDPISGEYSIEGEKTYRVDENDYENLKQKLKEENRSFKEQDVHLGNHSEYVEKIVLYRDEDHHQDIYASKYVIARFHIEPASEETSIEGKKCFRITDEDAQYIIDHQDNEYSPYIVEVRSIHLGKDDSIDQNYKELVLYRDLDDNNQVYSSEEVLNFFHMVPEGEAVTIEEKACYKIDTNTEDEMLRLADASDDPKVVIQYHDVHLKKKDEVQEKNEEYIPLLRDVDHNNQFYASSVVLERFGITPEGESKMIRGFECYLVSPEQLSIIEDQVEKSENPKLVIQYIDFHSEKGVDPIPPTDPEEKEETRKGAIHYQTVIKKLTDGLEHLGAREAKHYRASNIKISSAASELRTGNWLYNVFGTIPGVVRMPFLWFKKIAAKLMLKQEAKVDYEELERRLNEDLTEEELEVLFRQYRGSNALADMNPSINSMIADRMHRYVLEKVEKLNALIKVQYSRFFGYLEQIKALAKQLERDDLGEKEKESFLNQKKELMGLAAECARGITNNREEGIQLLSGGGLHAFEEDMKAVDSKMSYVGYRFAKAGKFDHETQELLAKFGQGFNDALANSDDEAIVENFLCYEACYFDNTEIRASIFGKRSVGTKYYSPLIEEMNYRDDPFIRNLLSTVAIVSSAVSAVNAYRVHKIESDKILEAQRQQAQKVNAQNDAVVNQAHQVGRNIEGHRQEMIDGMQSQVHHGVDEAALGLERKGLDVSADDLGWNLGGNYSSIDQANHVFYNNFHQDVSSRINDVTTRYGTGSIDQMQALREMATIANDSQQTLNGVVNECLTVLRNYAQSHPQFDLEGIEESMSYIATNPDAIIQMNNAAVDIMEQAGTLSGLSAAHMTALSSLPSDWLTTLISAASAATLATHVSSTMSQKFGKKGQYGNEVTEMMEEFLKGEEEVDEEVSEEEEEHHHTR